MSQGRGSAFLAALILAGLLVAAPLAHAANYVVGDGAGWSFNVESWTQGKNFVAGDVLTFNYSPVGHNVVEVDAASFQNCVVPSGAKTFDSGSDRITLNKGGNFFICGIPGHCQRGMKIAANAA